MLIFQGVDADISSLKLTRKSHLKMDGWKIRRRFLWDSAFFWGVNSLLIFGKVIATRSYKMLTQPKSQKIKRVVKGIWQQGHIFSKTWCFFCINKPSKQLMCKPRHLVKSYSHSSPSLIPNKLKHVIWFWVVFQIGLPQKLSCFLSPSGKLQPTCHVILRTQPGDQILSGSVHEFMQGLQILVVVFAFPHGII